MELYALTYNSYDNYEITTRLFFEKEDALNAILEDLNENEQLVCLDAGENSMYFRSFTNREKKVTKDEAWEFDYYFEFNINKVKVEGDFLGFLSKINKQTNYGWFAV